MLCEIDNQDLPITNNVVSLFQFQVRVAVPRLHRASNVILKTVSTPSSSSSDLETLALLLFTIAFCFITRHCHAGPRRVSRLAV